MVGLAGRALLRELRDRRGGGRGRRGRGRALRADRGQLLSVPPRFRARRRPGLRARRDAGRSPAFAAKPHGEPAPRGAARPLGLDRVVRRRAGRPCAAHRRGPGGARRYGGRDRGPDLARNRRRHRNPGSRGAWRAAPPAREVPGSGRAHLDRLAYASYRGRIRRLRRHRVPRGRLRPGRRLRERAGPEPADGRTAQGRGGHERLHHLHRQQLGGLGLYPPRRAAAGTRRARDPRRDARLAPGGARPRTHAGQRGPSRRHRRPARRRGARARARPWPLDMSPENLVQERYARWLDAATRITFAASLAAFVVYAGGLAPSFVPLEALAALWHLPVDEYLAQTGAPAGWGWLALLRYADYLALACIALVGTVTLACYLAILPLLLRLGERMEAALVAAQIVVLLIAASGAFAGGH